MRIGTYYYPEQWPKSQWERDFDSMSAMGLQIVHMGEFAWTAFEPEPGRYEMEWMAECLALADERGLKVILCTPTAAPPIWLIEQHPEVLPMDDAGRRMRFGGRRHYSPLAPALRSAAERIVTILGDHFGEYSNVLGWQIDNEYSGHFDQSETAHAAFRQWLREQYQTINGVNDAWGAPFWTAYYTDFSQIMLPPSRIPGYLSGTIGNPHQCLDASRFWSWAYASFNRLQANILRPRIGNKFLTTNFMPFHPDCNPKDMAGDLSLFSWDAYPVAGREVNPPNEQYRIGDPYFMGLVHSQMASYTGRWGLLELQPGQINWSGVPALPYPGAIRLWLWTAFAHGAEFTTTYRLRQPRFGIEMFHAGLLGPDGITQTAGGREFSQTILEIEKLDLARSPIPAEEFDPDKTVGLLFDFEQLWYYQILPQARRWNQPQWLRAWYAACARNGLKVKILHPESPWPQGLKMLMVPGQQMVDDPLVSRLKDYAREGGHLILTCRTGTMDRRGQLLEGPIGAAIAPLIAGTISAYDSLPEGKFGEVEMDGKKYKWGTWGDQLSEVPAAQVIAKYADQFYAGAAAVTQSRHGMGIVTYCGVCSEAPFVDALVEKLAPAAGLTLGKAPWRVLVMKRGKFNILLNYNEVPVDAPAKKTAKFIIGTRKTPAAGVAVWVDG